MPTVEHVQYLSEVAERRPTALAVGVFDGVHRGHRALLEQMLAAARAAELRPAVLTFFPHPRVVLGRLSGRFYLMPPQERVQRLAELGFALVIAHPFDEQVRLTRAAEFVDQMVRHLDLRQLWGGNFSLGYGREGTYDYLHAQGAVRGFTVHRVDRQTTVDGEAISSSRIRQALAAGDMEDAERCLGRPYAVEGEVVVGRKLGRTIGTPTANLHIWEQQLLPVHGVYAGRVRVGELWHPAAVNVGVRPTVDGETFTVEAHLIDFGRDIYGQTVRLEFVRRVRDERRFADLDALKAQIARDVEAVRAMLAARLLAQPGATADSSLSSS